MAEDYLMVLIRRAAQVVADVLRGRKDESPEILRQNLADDFRLVCGVDLALLLRRTPEELVDLLAVGGDALFAERALILAAVLTRLAGVQEGQSAVLSVLQGQALLDGLRARFGDDPALEETITAIEASLRPRQGSA